MGITIVNAAHAANDRPIAHLGPRPFFLDDDMDEGALEDALKQCESGPFYRSDFSIGHRGAAMQFPEHTSESYVAAARMGAGIVECDVTFTRDRQLVCRHSQCDLHTTTDILARPELAAKCTTPFSPADPAAARRPRLCAAPATSPSPSSEHSVARWTPPIRMRPLSRPT